MSPGPSSWLDTVPWRACEQSCPDFIVSAGLAFVNIHLFFRISRRLRKGPLLLLGKHTSKKRKPSIVYSTYLPVLHTILVGRRPQHEVWPIGCGVTLRSISVLWYFRCQSWLPKPTQAETAGGPLAALRHLDLPLPRSSSSFHPTPPWIARSIWRSFHSSVIARVGRSSVMPALRFPLGLPHLQPFL